MSDQTSPEVEASRIETGTGSPSTALLACRQCRSRKLKCDRVKPCCGRCSKSNDSCVYPQSRRSVFGRRRNVEDLESRIGQLEVAVNNSVEQHTSAPLQPELYDVPASFQTPAEVNQPSPALPSLLNFGEVIRLGLFEAPPSFQLVEELTDIYFKKHHHDSPMIHQQRYIASLHLPVHMSPPMCLQYIIMATAAISTDIYQHLAMPFYQRARAYASGDEMDGLKDNSMTLAHVQCWTLVANFEAQTTMFSRASTSLCRSVRVAYMLNLHKIDQGTQNTISPLGPPKDLIELEERRRTWWTVFCSDKLTSATTHWPSLIQDKDIKTLLPASDEAFEAGRLESTCLLTDELNQSAVYSPFAGRVLSSQIICRTASFTYEGSLEESIGMFETDSYWKDHVKIDNDLALMQALLPQSLRLTASFRSPDTIFVNIMTHTATICLHRAALWRAKLQPVPEYITNLCHNRLLIAAEEILNIFRTMPDLHVAFINPVTNFAAYMAALVFLEDGSTTIDYRSKDNLQFLLRIMVALSKGNSVARSLAIQLTQEMKQHGVTSPITEQLEQLSPAPIMVPLLAKINPSSSSVSFRLH